MLFIFKIMLRHFSKFRFFIWFCLPKCAQRLLNFFFTNFIDRISMSSSIWWHRVGRSRLPFSSWIVRSCVFGWNALPTGLDIRFRIICEIVHILLDPHRRWSLNKLVHICPNIASICHEHPNTLAVSLYPEMTFSTNLATNTKAKFNSVNFCFSQGNLNFYSIAILFIWSQFILRNLTILLMFGRCINSDNDTKRQSVELWSISCAVSTSFELFCACDSWQWTALFDHEFGSHVFYNVLVLNNSTVNIEIKRLKVQTCISQLIRKKWV